MITLGCPTVRAGHRFGTFDRWREQGAGESALAVRRVGEEAAGKGADRVQGATAGEETHDSRHKGAHTATAEAEREHADIKRGTDRRAPCEARDVQRGDSQHR